MHIYGVAPNLAKPSSNTVFHHSDILRDSRRLKSLQLDGLFNSLFMLATKEALKLHITAPVIPLRRYMPWRYNGPRRVTKCPDGEFCEPMPPNLGEDTRKIYVSYQNEILRFQ